MTIPLRSCLLLTGLLTAVFAISSVLIFDWRIKSEKALNESIVNAVLTGQATDAISSIHYETRFTTRGIPAVMAIDFDLVHTFHASRRINPDVLQLVLRLHGLEELRLTGETIDVPAMTLLQRMPKLRRLTVNDCTISEGMPAGDGPELTMLRLTNCRLKPGSLNALIGAGTVRELQIYYTDLSNEEIRSTVARLPKLEVLDLFHSRITNDALRPLTKLRSLRELYLGGSPTIDLPIRDLSCLDSLQVLRVSDAGLTDARIRELAGCRSLRELSVHGCQHVTRDSLDWLLARNSDLVIQFSN